MKICVPTTLEEWQAADEATGPFLLVSLTKEKTPALGLHQFAGRVRELQHA